MDFFQILEYQLADVQDQGSLPFLPLMRLKVTKVNIHMLDSLSYEDS